MTTAPRWSIVDVVRRASVVPRRARRLGAPPDVEVVEDAAFVVLTAAVPGIERERLRVDVAPHRVRIEAEGRARRGEDDAPAWDARVAGFEREVALLVEVHPRGARASLANGVLEVVVPKRNLGGHGVTRLLAE